MSVYDKDMGKLWLVLILTIVGSVSLLKYSYSYNLESSNKQDVLLTTIYNSGQNSCKITGNTIYNDVECKFTVMGYNKTNENKQYKIIIKNNQNNTISSDLIKIDLINKKQNINLESISLEGIEKKSLILKEILVPANSSDIFDEYIIRMSLDNDNFFSNYLNDNQFKINIDVIY